MSEWWCINCYNKECPTKGLDVTESEDNNNSICNKARDIYITKRLKELKEVESCLLPGSDYIIANNDWNKLSEEDKNYYNNIAIGNNKDMIKSSTL